MRTVPLRRLAHIVNGGTPKGDASNWDGDVPWATPVDLGTAHGGELSDTLRTLTDEGLETGSSAVPAGSVLLSTRAPVGYVTIATQRMAFNQGCKALVPDKRLNSRYLAYALQASTANLQVRSNGTTFLELSTEALKSTRIPYLTVPKQVQIADFLDRETAQIDAMIEAQEDLLQTLINRRAATRRRGFFALRDMADIRPLKHLARKVSGSAFPLEEQGEKGLDLPFYKVAALASRDVHGIIVTESDTIASETRARLGAHVIPTGSSLMAKIGAASLLARIGIISRDCCIDNNMVAFIARTGVDPRFLYHALCDIDIYPYINQSTIPYMNERAIMNAPIPLPNLAEQRRLVDKLDRELTKGSALVAETDSMIFLLRERREALITAAVSGRIDPTTGIERIEEAS